MRAFFPRDRLRRINGSVVTKPGFPRSHVETPVSDRSQRDSVSSCALTEGEHACFLRQCSSTPHGQCWIIRTRRTQPPKAPTHPRFPAKPDLVAGRNRRWESQGAYPIQNRFEQTAWNGHLCHLERHIARIMANHLRANLDPLVAERRQRPVADALGQRQPAKEVPQVVGQGEQLQPRLIIHEVVAGQPRPVQRVLAFFDPLLGCSATVVEVPRPSRPITPDSSR